MKKIYVLLVVVLSCINLSNAQTNYFWVGASGGAGGNWNNAANWSSASGGGGGFGVPNGISHNAVFDQGALVNVDIAGITLNGITVTNSSTATLFTTVATTITINSISSTAGSKALNINTGSTLKDSCDANVQFIISFANGSRGDVNGTWQFSGNGTVVGGNGATFALPLVAAQGNVLDVNGTIRMRPGSVTPGSTVSDEYLFFNSGSVFWLDRNGSSTPRSTWNTNSTMLITGTTSIIPTINIGAVAEIGNLVFDCVLNPAVLYSLSLPNLLTIKGNLQILNTNNQMLALASNGFGMTAFNASYNINGNFTISGASRVTLARASFSNKTAVFQLGGNLSVGGTSFDLQIANTPDVVANPVTLRVGGNVNHSAGSFGSSSNAINSTVDLFIVELNGVSNQNISSVAGSFDNANNEVTLRLDNAAGVTLTTPLAVGKLAFNTTNAGKINTTSTNVLTINNTGTHSLVLNSPGPTGFVNGPLRRKTASNTAYLMPTGKGTTYHATEILPTAATASEYEAEFFAAAFSDLSVQLPLTGVSNLEYWNIATISGSDAALLLTLNGTAVPGAVMGDAIAVGRYNGADWAYFSGLGTRIVPGNSTTGTTRSNTMVGLGGFFTFTFGPASALPVRLLTFEASRLSATSASVKWTISRDSDPAGFEVLRSSDGVNFSRIGNVAAVMGGIEYKFTDLNLQKGTNYYRLRITDREGNTTYSRVAVVLNDAKGTLITYMAPTIVQSVARLGITTSDKGNIQVAITDMQGRIMKLQQSTINPGSQELILQLQALASGTYQLTVYKDNQRISGIRFIKQ